MRRVDPENIYRDGKKLLHDFLRTGGRTERSDDFGVSHFGYSAVATNP
jgi:hypothetical protein